MDNNIKKRMCELTATGIKLASGMFISTRDIPSGGRLRYDICQHFGGCPDGIVVGFDAVREFSGNSDYLKEFFPDNVVIAYCVPEVSDKNREEYICFDLGYTNMHYRLPRSKDYIFYSLVSADTGVKRFKAIAALEPYGTKKRASPEPKGDNKPTCNCQEKFTEHLPDELRKRFKRFRGVFKCSKDGRLLSDVREGDYFIVVNSTALYWFENGIWQ